MHLRRRRRREIIVHVSWKQRSCMGMSEWRRRPVTLLLKQKESYCRAASMRTYKRKETSARPQEVTLQLTAKHLKGGKQPQTNPSSYLTYQCSLQCCNLYLFIFIYSYEKEEQDSNSGLDHLHHISEMCKLEENKLNEGDRDEPEGSFGSITLSDAINQPLFKKSKSQVMFL